MMKHAGICLSMPGLEKINMAEQHNGQPTSAVAVVTGSPAYPGIRGTVRFDQTRGGVVVKAEFSGLPQTPSGFFGFHLHSGDCKLSPDGAGGDWFPSAGSHYNPTSQPHPRHAGDFPVIMETRYGAAQLVFLTDRFTVAQAIGGAVVVHLQPDDYHTQPSGNAGPKIACGMVMPERGLY